MIYEEGPRVELKSELVPEICEEIRAFLNAEGGKIYIGVDDCGTVLGVPEGMKDIVDVALSNKINDNILPAANGCISHDYNSDNVLEVCVLPWEK